MIRLINLSVVFVLWFLISHASLAQSASQDPIFLQIDPKLGKVVYHRVGKQETLYGIAQKYGVEKELIKRSNSKLKDPRKLPAVLKIPIDENQVHYRVPLFKQKGDFIPVYYIAKRKDNPFRISRVVFDMPTNLLISRNKIKQNKIRDGQKLHIGWLKKNRVPLLVRIGKMSEDESESIGKSQEQEQFEFQLEEFSVIQENQVAFWNEDSDGKGLFVMHRMAPARSIIEIKNPMHNSVAYAKVIGKLPPNLYSKEIDMIVSKELAKELGVVDPKFFVQVRYKGTRTVSSR